MLGGGASHRCADGGWSTLFRDPSDGRLWERLIRRGICTAAALPVLRVIAREEAIWRYGAASID